MPSCRHECPDPRPQLRLVEHQVRGFRCEVDPLPRKPLWGGQVEGIGGASARLVQANAAPVALSLHRKRPYHAALQQVRSAVVRQTGGRLPAAVAHRVVHGGSKYAAPVLVDHVVLEVLKSYIPLAPLHQPFTLQAIELLLAEAAGPAAGGVLRHRVPPHAAGSRADVPAAACPVGTRRAALWLPRLVLRVHDARARRAPRRRRTGAHDRRAPRQRREPLCDARTAQRRHDDGLFRARRSDDGHALWLARPRRAAASDAKREARRGAAMHRLNHESGFSASRACRRMRSRCSQWRTRIHGRARRSSCTWYASCAKSAR